MKIVMLCDFYQESLEYQENLLARYYVKHGHEVTVIASTCDSVFEYVSGKVDRHAPARNYVHQGVKIIKLPYRINLLNRLRLFAGVEQIFEAEAPDLIFIHDIMLNVLDVVRYVRRHRRCRVIMDYHADYSNSANGWLSLAILHGTIRKRFLNHVRPYLQKIFPIVPASATFLHEVYGVPHSEMELLPLGADLDLVREIVQRGARERIRAQYGVKDDDRLVFSGGKLAPQKRTEMLIEAFLALDRPNLHLLIVGDSTQADVQYKERLVAAAGNHPRIHFTGWLDAAQVYAHMAAADFAVFPASQSVLWQQAIASGLPLVVGDVGHQDPSYLNQHENIRILRGPDINPQRIAQAVAELFDDNGLRERMAAGARRVAEEVLDWNKLILKTLRYNAA